MSNSDGKTTLKKLSELTDDILLRLLKGLPLTDLILVGGTCNRFKQMEKFCLSKRSRDNSSFRESLSFPRNPLKMATEFHASGLFLCHHDRLEEEFEVLHTLDVVNLFTGATDARLHLDNIYPEYIAFSNTAQFVTVFCERNVRIFRVNADKGTMTLCGKVVFDPSSDGIVPPTGMRYCSLKSRIIVSFSQSDDEVVVTRLFGNPKFPHRIQVRMVTLGLKRTDKPGQTSDSAKNDTHVFVKTKNDISIHFRRPRCGEDVGGVQVSASPLRILFPPGSIVNSGLLKPHETSSSSLLSIPRSSEEDGDLFKANISSCGSFYLEVRTRWSDSSEFVALAVFDISSGHLKGWRKIEFNGHGRVLDIRFSRDAMMAVIFLASDDDSAKLIQGWHIAYLLEGGQISVVRDTAIRVHQNYLLDKEIQLSDDGQLISIVCHREEDDDGIPVALFETATGRLVKRTVCACHESRLAIHQGWSENGVQICSHAIASNNSSVTLALWAEEEVTFTQIM